MKNHNLFVFGHELVAGSGFDFYAFLWEIFESIMKNNIHPTRFGANKNEIRASSLVFASLFPLC